jgi:hypothetical protein
VGIIHHPDFEWRLIAESDQQVAGIGRENSGRRDQQATLDEAGGPEDFTSANNASDCLLNEFFHLHGVAPVFSVLGMRVYLQGVPRGSLLAEVAVESDRIPFHPGIDVRDLIHAQDLATVVGRFHADIQRAAHSHIGAGAILHVEDHGQTRVHSEPGARGGGHGRGCQRCQIEVRSVAIGNGGNLRARIDQPFFTHNHASGAFSAFGAADLERPQIADAGAVPSKITHARKKELDDIETDRFEIEHAARTLLLHGVEDFMHGITEVNCPWAKPTTLPRKLSRRFAYCDSKRLFWASKSSRWAVVMRRLATS